jgi:hypothetical protein
MRRRISSILFASALVVALAPAAVADEHRDIDDVHAEVSLPEEFTLGEPERIALSFENRTEWDITDAVVSMTLRGYEPDTLDAWAEGAVGPIEGERDTFELRVAEHTAALPPDGGFTIGAGETVQLDLDITIEDAPHSGQLEVRVAGEIDGEMTGDGDFQAFSIAGVEDDAVGERDPDTQPDAEDEADERPEEIPAGSAGLAADGAATVPIVLGLLGGLLLLGALLAPRLRRQH